MERVVRVFTWKGSVHIKEHHGNCMIGGTKT